MQTILITGCSSGIGLRTATTLKARGYRVFATARKAEDIATLKAKGFESFQLDLNDSDSITNAVNQILAVTDGTLDALVNNAGYGQPGALEDLSRDQLRQQFETNVFGTQELTNKILPVMRKQGHGRIIYISSLLGFIALPYRGAYNASKHALEGLADTLRLELRHTPIFVSIIEPGPIISQFRDNVITSFQSVHTSSSAHRDNYQRFLANFQKTKQPFYVSPDKVVKRIINALETKKPKIRYYVTFPTYLFAILKRFLTNRRFANVLARVADREIQ
jgi:short-subunit dehydrogenase